MQRKIDQLEPFQRAISKAHLASAGIAIDSLEDPDKPLIAIANSWNEVCPGHEPLRQLAAEVKKGVLEAGGGPIQTLLACAMASPKGIPVCATACRTATSSPTPARP
mgnify:CR=1 FL=1